MEIADFISNGIAIAVLVIIVLQLRLGLKTLKADHERRKKQATIEYINSIRQLWSENVKLLDEKYSVNTLSEENLQEIESNPEIRDIIKDLLGKLEHMSVGMNTDVFDKDLLYRMSASYLIRIYRRLLPYISFVQKGNPFAYIEFQEIILDFENRKRVRPDPRGEIIHS